jgi:phage-related minor tail protein
MMQMFSNPTDLLFRTNNHTIMENWSDEFKVKGEDLLKKIREIIHEGNVSRIIIKNDEGKTFIEIPVTIGVIGAILAPILAAVGALAALAASFTIEVVRREE